MTQENDGQIGINPIAEKMFISDRLDTKTIQNLTNDASEKAKSLLENTFKDLTDKEIDAQLKMTSQMAINMLANNILNSCKRSDTQPTKDNMKLIYQHIVNAVSETFTAFVEEYNKEMIKQGKVHPDMTNNVQEVDFSKKH